MILADAIHARFKAEIEKPTTSESDRAELKGLDENKTLTGKDIESFLKKLTLPKDDKQAIAVLAGELNEEHKWLTPHELEEAKVTVDGEPSQPFESWFRSIVQKKRQADMSTDGSVALNEVEESAYEVGGRLVHYQSIRDREPGSPMPLYVIPRPSNPAHLAYVGALVEKFRKQELASPTPLENDAAVSLQTYWEDVPNENRAVPGTQTKTDAAFSAWLKNRSVWIPLKVILDSKPEELAAAGFDSEKAAAFQRTFRELERAEDSAPGAVSEAKANEFVAAARELGASLNAESYPTTGDIARETYFNRTNPFWNAPIAYGLATVLLAISLGFNGFTEGTLGFKFGRGLYYGGLLGLVAGIVLETVGFSLRVSISGWAPVTNMYETVIWVSFVGAILGIVFEMIYHKTFTALAGAGMAFPGTLLAANVALLDPNIHALQPVLRSNYWLTIHVLTEVRATGHSCSPRRSV